MAKETDYGKSFFDLEPDIRDVENMAKIVCQLFHSGVTSTEMIGFAVNQTAGLAIALREKYYNLLGESREEVA